MRNTIYRVEFQINSLLNDEFDFKDDALEWAAEHLDDKPVVRAIDIEYPDEFGAEPIIHEEEEIFHYPVEEVSDQEEDNLDARLAALEADEFDGHENLNEVIQVEKPTRALQYEFTDYDDDGELSEPAQKLDKAAADVSKDEAAYNTEEAEKIRQEYQNLEAACIEAEKAQHDAFMAAMDNYERKLNDPVSLTLDQINERNAAIAADENYKKAREATRAAIQAYRQFGADHHAEIFGIYDTTANFSDMVKDAKRAGYKRYKELTAKESLEEGIISEIDSVAAKWNSIDSTKQEALEEDVILFDPFGCDFSECEPMEVCKDNHRADCYDDLCQSPADFLRDIARSLGIEDEVEISEVSDEAKDLEDIVPEEVKANEEPNVDVQVEDEEPAEEISKCHVCPECGKEICECDKQKLDEAGNYTPRAALTAVNTKTGEVEREFAHYSLPINGQSDVKKLLAVVQADQDAFLKKLGPDWVEATPDNMDKYANWKKLLKDDLNSECGKEICEAKDNEDVAIAYVPEETEPVTDKEKCRADIMKERQEYCKKNNTINVPIEIEKEIIKRNIKKYNIQPDAKYTLDENQVLTDYVQGEMAKGKSAEEVAETDEFKELAKEEAIKELSEESHPDEAQPEVDHVKAFNAALEVAKKENKPVIYGYMGADHHGKNRYFEIEHVVCDDLNNCRDEVMKQYHPNGSILVAYPDKDFVEESINNLLADKPFINEDVAAVQDASAELISTEVGEMAKDIVTEDIFDDAKEMSDEEFAEALKKGLEEKHAKK